LPLVLRSIFININKNCLFEAEQEARDKNKNASFAPPLVRSIFVFLTPASCSYFYYYNKNNNKNEARAKVQKTKMLPLQARGGAGGSRARDKKYS
jgi:hypothetical protein